MGSPFVTILPNPLTLLTPRIGHAHGSSPLDSPAPPSPGAFAPCRGSPHFLKSSWGPSLVSAQWKGTGCPSHCGHSTHSRGYSQ